MLLLWWKSWIHPWFDSNPFTDIFVFLIKTCRCICISWCCRFAGKLWHVRFILVYIYIWFMLGQIPCMLASLLSWSLVLRLSLSFACLVMDFHELPEVCRLDTSTYIYIEPMQFSPKKAFHMECHRKIRYERGAKQLALYIIYMALQR